MLPGVTPGSGIIAIYAAGARKCSVPFASIKCTYILDALLWRLFTRVVFIYYTDCSVSGEAFTVDFHGDYYSVRSDIFAG